MLKAAKPPDTEINDSNPRRRSVSKMKKASKTSNDQDIQQEVTNNAKKKSKASSKKGKISLPIPSSFTRKDKLSKNEKSEAETEEAEENDKGLLGDVSEDIEKALKRGQKKWGRSKIMIVGEGRAGKTALANAVIGKPFEETHSTIGINQLSCDVKYAAVGGADGGGWVEREKPEREMEAAVASMIASGVEPSVAVANDPVVNDSEALLRAQLDSSPGISAATRAESSMRTGGGGLSLPADASMYHSLDKGRDGNDLGKYMEEGLVISDVGLCDRVTVTAEEAKQFDNDLVLKCLSDKIQTSTKFVISVFDFGGQSVFNVIHHFFLTRQGVYCVVFNMEWLVGNDQATKSQCLDTLKFWINAIVVHTYNNELKETAPIFLVGTRKDKVSSPADHHKISTILYENFSSSLAWPNVIENNKNSGANGIASMFFYPVDNVAGRNDPSVQVLLSDIERTIDNSDYVHVERPLAYLQTLDRLTSLGVSFLSYEDAVDVASKCGVASDQVIDMLSLFHNMGMLMFHDEPGLRDVVILDPVAYFVTPATTVICKHVPTEQDPTHHWLEVHKQCQKKMHADWQKMVSEGVVSHRLLQMLLDDHKDQFPLLERLMLKFGLLVQLHSSQSQKDSGSHDSEYLVPALLPCASSSAEAWSDSEWSTCYLLFTTSETFQRFPTINRDDLSTYGFLPSGLFEKLMGKAVMWAQSTSATSSSGSSTRNFSLKHDEAVVCFGCRRFRMKVRPDMSAIEVNIEGRHVRAVHQRLMNQVTDIINECMKSLFCFSALSYPYSSSSASSPPFSFTDDNFLIPLDEIRSIVSSHSVLNRPGGRRLLSEADAVDMFRDWMEQKDEQRSEYDVFLSYRWGPSDSTFVQSVFDRFGLFTTGEGGREVQVFLDRECLQEGRLFQNEFASSLKNTLVVVPVVSSDALRRMCSGSPLVEDNVLVEWAMSLECYFSDKSRVCRIFPIFFGSRTDAYGKIDNLFVEREYTSLPDIIPTASLELAGKLLASNGINPRPEFYRMTVSSIVNQMKRFLCVFAWNIDRVDLVTPECTSQVLKMLRVALLEQGNEGDLCSSTSAEGAADSEAPALLGGSTMSPSKGCIGRSLKECVAVLRETLDIDEANPGKVIALSLDLLSSADESLREECNKLNTVLLKARFLANQVS